jgi:hypothetical protein
MKLLLLLLLWLAVSVRAQSDFHAYPGIENLAEGNSAEKLTVISHNLQFNVRPPRDWSHWVNESSRKIVFTSPSGQSALTVQFTTNSPGTLPEKDILRTQALQAHPGAAIYNFAAFATGYRPGVFFDLASIPAPHVVQKIRHAFVAGPAGEVEFILSASEAEFATDRIVLMSMLGAFRVDPAKPGPP